MQKTNLFLSRILPKINVGLVSVISGCVLASNAIAATNCSPTACTVDSSVVNFVSCRLSAQSFAVGGVCIATCGESEAACYDNYHLVTKTYYVSGCGDIEYTDCEPDEDIDDGDDTGGDIDTPGTKLCFFPFDNAPCVGDESLLFKSINGCETEKLRCFGTTTFNTCTKCKEGYTDTTKTITDPDCSNTTSQNTCSMPCTEDSDCEALTTDWSSPLNGAQSRTIGSCFFGQCETTQETRCIPGYYKLNNKPVLATCSKCEAGYYCPDGTSKLSCAEKTGDSPATSPAGSDSISKCYVPANKTYQNSTGQFEFSMDCYYKQ
ncbi:MAG: hypothetical protein IJ500_01015 [Alphaproteobacteria bacterium]|nr:hypothetical protein [Alphaproteobacteria bacterium]